MLNEYTNKEKYMKDFAFGKENFVLMSGGSSPDGVSFNPEIFSTRRIVVAPIITVLGFALVMIGILKKPKDASSANTDNDKA